MSNTSRKAQIQLCQICGNSPFKYTCPTCQVVYCSLKCYKEHKTKSCSAKSAPNTGPGPALDPLAEIRRNIDSMPTDSVGSGEAHGASSLPDPQPLRPLASLRWPYIPEAPSYPDPLAKEEAKPLQLSQYEAIATSPRIRKVLAENPRLKELLNSIDGLQGNDREWELQKVLGVAVDFNGTAIPPGRPQEEVKALRELAEAIEEIARVPQGDGPAGGLDWGDDEI